MPAALCGTMAAPLGGWLANRLGVQRTVLVGLLLQGVGVVWIWRMVAPTLSIWQLAGPFALFGLGSGLAGAQLNTATLQDVSRERTGDASSAAITLRQLGAPFAAALVGLLLESSVTRLVLAGYDRSARGIGAMESVMLAIMVINGVCLIGLSHVAQFITLCSASNLAEARRFSSPLQGSSPAKTRASSRLRGLQCPWTLSSTFYKLL
jgi:MFS family permease